jgi:hypothetical protein
MNPDLAQIIEAYLAGRLSLESAARDLLALDPAKTGPWTLEMSPRLRRLFAEVHRLKTGEDQHTPPGARYYPDSDDPAAAIQEDLALGIWVALERATTRSFSLWLNASGAYPQTIITWVPLSVTETECLCLGAMGRRWNVKTFEVRSAKFEVTHYLTAYTEWEPGLFVQATASMVHFSESLTILASVRDDEHAAA